MDVGVGDGDHLQGDHEHDHGNIHTHEKSDVIAPMEGVAVPPHGVHAACPYLTSLIAATLTRLTPSPYPQNDSIAASRAAWRAYLRLGVTGAGQYVHAPVAA